VSIEESIMDAQVLFGEKATTKLAAVFDTEVDANGVAEQLRSAAGMNAGQVRVLAPGDFKFDKKLEPEPAGVARTLVRTHVILGVAGFVLGIILWLGLYWANVGLIRSTPYPSAIAIIFFLTMAGLLLGGFLALPPDQQSLAGRLRKALTEGKRCVIVHPRSPEECDAVERMLTQGGVTAMRSV